MLGKLIRFDMRSSARLLLPLHLAAFVFTLCSRLLFVTGLPSSTPEEFIVLWFTLYALLLVCTGIISSFYFIYWFYKNLFTDEGYLMHTLPAHPWQHILSKLSCMCIWQIIDTLVIGFCIYILTTVNAEFTKELPALLNRGLRMLALEFDTSSGLLIFKGILVFLVAMLIRGLSAFMCIAIGQLFNKHRVLAAFLAYIGLNILISLLSSSLMTATNFTVDAVNAPDLIHFYFYLELISDLILGTIYFFVTKYLMDRRLNLE